MKPKYSAAALKTMALECRLAPCESRAFAAYHADTLATTNHIEYTEAFILQLGVPAQHGAILALLATCARGFNAGQNRIAYKPPGSVQLGAVLDVARWVSARLEGGLAHAHVRQPPAPFGSSPHAVDRAEGRESPRLDRCSSARGATTRAVCGHPQWASPHPCPRPRS